MILMQVYNINRTNRTTPIASIIGDNDESDFIVVSKINKTTPFLQNEHKRTISCITH